MKQFSTGEVIGQLHGANPRMTAPIISVRALLHPTPFSKSLVILNDIHSDSDRNPQPVDRTQNDNWKNISERGRKSGKSDIHALHKAAMFVIPPVR